MCIGKASFNIFNHEKKMKETSVLILIIDSASIYTKTK